MRRLLPTVKRALPGRRRSAALFECRHCGERVDCSTVSCPACGHTGIAEYEVE